MAATQDFFTYDAYRPISSLGTLVAVDRVDGALRNRMALLNLGGQMLGGQLAAHALMAACVERAEVDPASLHMHFVSACEPTRPYTLLVEQLRAGRRMLHVSLRGMQDGRCVTESSVLLRDKTPAPAGRPNNFRAPAPERGTPEEAFPRAAILDHHPGELGALDNALLLAHPYLEIRDVAGPVRFAGVTSHRSAYWLRAPDAGELSGAEQFALLALATDFWFTVPMFSQVADRRSLTSKFTSTSLDHAIWFHARPCCDQWLLFDVELLVIADQSAVMRMSITDRWGAPVATVMQESFLQPIAR